MAAQAEIARETAVVACHWAVSGFDQVEWIVGSLDSVGCVAVAWQKLLQG